MLESLDDGTALILTNAHVVESSDWINIIVYDLESFEGTILGLE